MRSPTIVLAVLGLAVAAYWFTSGRWVTPPQDATPTRPGTEVSVSSFPAPLASVEPHDTARRVDPIRIHGGIESERDGRPLWLWVAADGRILTEEEIAVESGGTVSASMVRGVRRLKGSGVIYGGSEQEGMPVRGASVFAENLPKTPPAMALPEEALLVDQGASKDPLATPPPLR